MRTPAITLSPQCAAILAELKAGTRTSLELVRATGVLALGARIHELRVALCVAGYELETRLIEARNRHRQRCRIAQYTLRPLATRRSRAKARRAA